MILTCPACGTSYVVKDGAIPPQGRQVRCASCKHSWHQDAEADGVAVAPAPVEEVSEPSKPESFRLGAEASGGHRGGEQERYSPDDAGVHPAEPATEQGHNDGRERAAPVPASDDDNAVLTEKPSEQIAVTAPHPLEDFTAWDHGGGDEDYASPPRRTGLVLLLGGLLLVVALCTAAWFFAPRQWLARAGLREASGPSPLKLMVSGPGRQKLASGNDLVSLSGRIINPTEETLNVPPLQADLRDGGGKVVYSWTIAPPAPKLPPRGSTSFNSAELGVPPDATSLTLRWAD